MIARFDHHPMLTAALALTTAVLVVVVITLATLLITAEPPAATSSSQSGGVVGNPGAAVAGTGETYGSMWIAPNSTQKGASVAPHQDVPSAHYGS